MMQITWHGEAQAITAHRRAYTRRQLANVAVPLSIFRQIIDYNRRERCAPIRSSRTRALSPVG
jgi:hypothetical protein